MVKDYRSRASNGGLFHIVLEIPASAISQEKEIRGINIRKEEIKLAQFADDVFVIRENPRNLAKLLEVILKFSKAAG
jgi:hypothetical protein